MLSGAISEFAISEMSGEGAPVLVPAAGVERFSTHSITTGSSDNPPSTPIEGRILGNFTLRREIAGGPGGMLGGLIQTEIASEVVLDNSNRALDYLLDRFVDGRDVRFLIGPPSSAYQDMQLVLTATGGSFAADETTIRLRLRDQGLLLQSEIQDQIYGGTGGQEGDPALKGRSKPLLYGRCLNVPAQLIDEALLVYQVAAGTELDSLTPYDAGIAIQPETNHLTFSEMVAAPCPPGKYVSCLAEGVFRLQIVPTGQVTADATAGLTSTTATIIDQILTAAGVPAALRSISDGPDAVDLPGFFQPAGANASVEDVVTQLAFAAGATFGADREGIYRLTWIDPNVFDRGPDFTFNDRDLAVIERVPLPYGVPWSGWVLGSQRNWTVQTSGELALSLSPARRMFLEREFREIRTSDPEVGLRHSTSRESELIPTFQSTPAGVITLGNRLVKWYALGRAMYQIVVKTALFQVEIGDIVEITSAHWGLDAGKRCVVVAVSDDVGAVQTEMTLFG